jgi:hypothetical protein
VHKMMNDKNREMVIQLFGKIQSSFPNLKMFLDLDPENVDVELDIPKQNGLLFDISLNLQNTNELHLNAGALWQEWFPCSEQSISQQFFNVVFGLLAGTNRIVEYHRGSKIVKAVIQQPKGDDWETIASWSCLHLPLPFGIKTRTLKNAQQITTADGGE